MGLFSRIIDIQKLNQAWEKVRLNRAAAGVDGISSEKFEENRREYIKELHQELADHCYSPRPVKLITIQKNEKQREIGIFCIRDKIVQQAIYYELNRLYDASLCESVYAYRPNRSAIRAVNDINSVIQKERYSYFLESDIEKFFDSICIMELMRVLERRIKERDVLELIERCLKVPYLDENGTKKEKENGLYQGSILAPLLSNVYLSDFDKFVEYKEVNYYRYSDDFILFSNEKEKLEMLLAGIQQFLKKIGLNLKEEKTRIGMVATGFDFLGYHFNQDGKQIPIKAEKTLSDKLEYLWMEERDWEKKIRKGMEILGGWEQYYNKKEIPNDLYEYVLVVAQLKKARKAIPNEIRELRWNYDNIHKDIMKYLVSIWEEYERFDMALMEYEQYYETLYLDENRMPYRNEQKVKELLEKFDKIAIQESEENLTELLQLYSDLGCYNKAEQISKRLKNNGKQVIDVQVSDFTEKAAQIEINLTDKEIERYQELFIGREDTYAVEVLMPDGRRMFENTLQPISEKEIQKHLKGDCTIATYVQRNNGTVKYIVFDVDISKKILLKLGRDEVLFQEYMKKAGKIALQIQAVIRKMGMESYIENSGYRGYHVWLFLNGWIRTQYANMFQEAVIRQLNLENDINVECFPNRSKVKDGKMGQLIKIPWGIHSRTGRRTQFLDEQLSPYSVQNQLLEKICCFPSEKIKRAAAAFCGEETTEKIKEIPIDETLLENCEENIRIVVESCGLIRYLCNKAKSTGYLSHQERLTLSYVFGHLGEAGKEFIHKIMEYTMNYQYTVTEKFIQKLPAKPISCIKLREQYKQLTAEIGCNCRFKKIKNCYPSPVLHALKESEQEQEDITLPISRTLTKENQKKVYEEINIHKRTEELAGKLVELKKQRRGIEKNIKKQEEELVRIFDQAQINSLEIDMGTLIRRKSDEGYEWSIAL